MESSSTLTDLTYLRSLTGGANDKMSKYIRMFLTGAPISIQQMEMYSLNGDWTGLRQTAHALKPQLGYFGAKSSEELLKQIERQADEQSGLEAIPQQLEEFKKQFNLISTELEQALKDLGN